MIEAEGMESRSLQRESSDIQAKMASARNGLDHAVQKLTDTQTEIDDSDRLQGIVIVVSTYLIVLIVEHLYEQPNNSGTRF